MKIAIKKGFGGFSISIEAAKFMAERGSDLAKISIDRFSLTKKWFGCGLYPGFTGGWDRADPLLIQAIEDLGEKTSNNECILKVVDIPDGIEYYIDEDECGRETIHEQHRIWD